MYLVQIFLPLFDNSGNHFSSKQFKSVETHLAGRFGGLTGYTRAPVHGLWNSGEAATKSDDLVIYEVMTETLDRKWWSAYRSELQQTFRQEHVLIRAETVRLL
jgi:hypothetical protein